MKNLPLLLMVAAMLFLSAVTMQPPATVKPAVPIAIECHRIWRGDMDAFLKNKTKYGWVLKEVAFDRGDPYVIIEKY